MSPDRAEKITKLRRKLKKKKEQVQREEEARIAQEAEELKQAKVITIYDKEPCAMPGCRNNAVGKGDTCRKHGGDPIIRENLLADTEIPDAVLNGTKYDPAFHPMEFLTLAREGHNEVEIAASFGVSVYTLRSWSEKFLQFNTAYEIGQAMYEAWWQRQGKDNLDNRGFNTGLFKYLTMNNLGWSDKVESKNLNIQAGVLVAPAPMDSKGWEEKYAAETDNSE